MNTLTVLVGSKNPVKVEAARSTLQALFPEQQIECQGISAPSGVPDQPMTAEQTRLGAVNRVEYCKAKQQADYYVAMEGGVDEFEYGPCTFAYVVIASADTVSVGRSAILPLPQQIFDALKQGEELGTVMDRLFDTTNIKQKGGAIGLLTNGLETRGSAYQQAMTLAMARFLHPALYKA